MKNVNFRNLRTNLKLKWRQSLGFVREVDADLLCMLLESTLTPKEIAEQLALDKSTLTRILQKLKKKTLITISKSKLDHRSKFVELTKKGELLVKKVESDFKISLQQISASLLREEILVLENFSQLLAEKTLKQSKLLCYKIERATRANDLDLYALLLDSKLYERPNKMLSLQYKKSRHRLLLAKHRNKVVACIGVAAYQNESFSCEIRDFAVAKRQQGRGLGKLILEAAIKEAAKLEYVNIKIRSSDQHKALNAVLLATGFIARKTTGDLIWSYKI